MYRPGSDSRFGPTRAVVLSVLLITSLAFGACASDPPVEAGDGVGIVVTNAIWADIVSNIACDDAGVQLDSMVPRGVDPHSFEPSLQDRARLEGAQLIIANGLGLEGLMADTIDAAASAGTEIIYIGELLDPVPHSGVGHTHGTADDGGSADDDHGHDHGPADHVDDGHLDPHVWLDPLRIADSLDPLADALVSIGLDASAVEGCVADYRERLHQVDEELTTAFGEIDQSARKVVTTHDSFGYFADRYELEVIGTVNVGASTLADASPAHLQELAEEIRHEAVRVVLAEPAIAIDTAERLVAVSSTADAPVELLTVAADTLGPADGERGDYLGMIRDLGVTIADALKGR